MSASAAVIAGQRRAVGSSRAALWVLVLVAVAVAVPVYRSGEAVALDVLLLFALPAVLKAAWRQPFLRWALIWSLVWLVAQFLSDLYHHTQKISSLSSVGVAAVILASGLYWLREKLNLSPAALLLPVGVGWALLEIRLGHAFAQGNPWKDGIGEPVSLAVLSLAYCLGATRKMIAAIVVALGVVSFANDCRFFLGVFAFTLAGLWLTRPGRRSVRRGSVILAVLAILVGFYALYPVAARSGLAGARAQSQQKIYDQNGTNFLLANRPELIQNAYIFAHHPIGGVGTNAILSGGEANAALGFTARNTQPLNINSTTYLLGGGVVGVQRATVETGYQNHSQAMSAALHGGFLVLPFWVFLLVGLVRAVLASSRRGTTVPAMVFCFSAWSFWDALFSPVSTRTHLPLAATLFLVAVALERRTSPADEG